MKRTLLLSISLLLFIGCASAPKSGIVALKREDQAAETRWYLGGPGISVIKRPNVKWYIVSDGWNLYNVAIDQTNAGEVVKWEAAEVGDKWPR